VTLWVIAVLLPGAVPAQDEEDEPADLFEWARRLEELDLSWRWGEFAFEVSGELDLEAYVFGDESPGATAEDPAVRSGEYRRSSRSDSPEFGGRLRLFLDASWGEALEGSVELRADGTTAADGEAGARFEQYWLRVRALSGEAPVRVQAGKFAAPVGNFIPRSSARRNPLVTWPLPYDALTALASLEDTVPVVLARRDVPDRKDWFVPIWREVYGTGVEGGLEWGDWNVRAALLNSAPATLPEDWDRKAGDPGFYNVYGRIVWTAHVTTRLGASASRGAYAKRDGRDAEEEPQTLLGVDAEFALGHLEIFAEAYWTRFEAPRLPDLELWTAYVEAKYTFLPGLFGAVRLAQIRFDEIRDPSGGRAHWDRGVRRLELGGGYFFTPNFFVKTTLQLNDHQGGPEPDDNLLALQVGLTF
jgi:hypothetical protein